jgi:arylsulfatase A-like enzyme
MFPASAAGTYKPPNIDRLAVEGMNLTHRTASAVFTATRMGLATGRYQYRVVVGLAGDIVMKH